MTTRKRKRRLDELLLARRLVEDRDQALQLIRAGLVYVEETVADKPGVIFPEDAAIRISQRPPYVSRGGLKLAGALARFDIDPTGWICADIGASTGGFTDCLLQHGAKTVYAVDVAYGILHWKLRNDPRVMVRERLNARAVSRRSIELPLDLAVLDTSFISLIKVIPPLLPLFAAAVRIIALIKPQFELERGRVEPGGIVRDEQARLDAVSTIRQFGASCGLRCAGVIPAAIKGSKGNQEYLIFFTGKPAE